MPDIARSLWWRDRAIVGKQLAVGRQKTGETSAWRRQLRMQKERSLKMWHVSRSLEDKPSSRDTMVPWPCGWYLPLPVLSWSLGLPCNDALASCCFAGEVYRTAS